MSSPFDGKVVAITGAGKGLGRAYALHFAELGASVVVNNRRHEGEAVSSADRVVNEITKTGGSAVTEYSSVEDPDAGDRLLACALENFGRIDCLVANAGIIETRSFRKQTLQSLREVLEINLVGTINVVHPIFRHMCEQHGGNIIVSTSSAGLFGEFGLPAYSASKAAVIGLMRSLNLEGAPKQVWVNAIAPYASTQMTAAHLSDGINSRLDPDHVAPVVTWLASCAFGGEILIAGGGRVARARMQTTGAMPLAEGCSQALQTLQTAEANLDFDSAGSNFQAFIVGLDAQDGD
ncbi:MAG: SDR family NAD(P)-dependent oxidoreductase [Gammaproteobacteria bacterium]|nr:SDR family NAD(P)-dependent oxidoreductase [Gammaproteobacteria bacterium]